MKVLIKTDVAIPGVPQFNTGETYDVDETIGNALVERGQAELVSEQPKSSNKKTTNSDKE